MEKNYYQILEVDKNASPEVIEKAYKTLVKKYHPDLQQDSDKSTSEETIKKINEAYEVLSDKSKRENYDIKLNNYDQMLKAKHDEALKREMQNRERVVNNPTPPINNIVNTTISNPVKSSNVKEADNTNNTSVEKLNKKIEKQVYKEQKKLLKSQRLAYQNAYISELRNRGYNVKYKKSFKNYLSAFIFIIALILIAFILWHIPFIKNYLIDLYNNNIIFHMIGSLIANIINIFI